MPINNRGLSGQPILPYVDYRSYEGVDVFIDLTFLDHTGTPIVPTTFQYQIDDLTNSVNVAPLTSVSVSATIFTLQISGSVLQLTHVWQGSEIFQISMIATWTDPITHASCTTKGVAILELLAIQTPTNTV